MSGEHIVRLRAFQSLCARNPEQSYQSDELRDALALLDDYTTLNLQAMYLHNQSLNFHERMENAEARLAEAVNVVRDLCRQIHEFSAREGEADFYTGDALALLSDYDAVNAKFVKVRETLDEAITLLERWHESYGVAPSAQTECLDDDTTTFLGFRNKQQSRNSSTE